MNDAAKCSDTKAEIAKMNFMQRRTYRNAANNAKLKLKKN